MSFTFIAAVSGGNDAAGTTLDTSSSLNVAAGDTLAAWCGHEGANGTFAVAKTTGGNDFTFDAEDEENHSNGDLNGSWGYLLSAAADATFTGRFTSSSREFRRIIILQFRPDSGDTVSKDGSAAGQGTSTAANSGNFTTAGTDGMACGGYKEYTSATTSSELINGGAATPVVVGEGLAGLSESELTDEKREDIATALGVPHSLLFSNATNFATAEQDELNFYKQTIIPDATAIARAMNRQYFEPAGYRLHFQPDQMDIFQEDEEDRSGAFWNYAQALKAADPKVSSVVMQIVGVELPGGMTWEEWEKILAEAQAKRQAQAEKLALSKQGGKGDEEDEDKIKPAQGSMPEGAPGPVASEVKALDDLALYADLERWQKKALKRLKSAPTAGCEFESPNIPADIALLIEEMLGEATTAEQVRAIFQVEV